MTVAVFRTATRALGALLLATTLVACNALQAGDDVDRTVPMRWDHVDASDGWETAAFAALDTHASILPDVIPEDIADWCPAYETADEPQREAFWVGLMSTLARHESTWNPAVVGGGGRWFGLVQISPGTARAYGCDARSGNALLDGAANVSCALRIWATTVPRDNRVASGNRGVAADWGPLHSSQSRKREDMRNWISAQPYCQG